MTGAGLQLGWTGKLPCRGDFVEGGRRLSLFDWFDRWASEGAAGVRSAGGPAADRFLTAPLVRFAAVAGTMGTRPAVGVIGPGMDRSGRLFPFLIAAEPDKLEDPAGTLGGNAAWYEHIEEAFLDFLSPDFDVGLIAGRLAEAPSLQDAEGGPAGGIAYMSVGGSVERTGDGLDFATVFGVPQFAAGLDRQHG